MLYETQILHLNLKAHYSQYFVGLKYIFQTNTRFPFKPIFDPEETLKQHVAWAQRPSFESQIILGNVWYVNLRWWYLSLRSIKQNGDLRSEIWHFWPLRYEKISNFVTCEPCFSCEQYDQWGPYVQHFKVYKSSTAILGEACCNLNHN